MDLERGMPSKRKSSACVDYVPALCTHRPSLLPIERFSEVLGLFGSRITLTAWREDDQTVAFRGSKSRNKVSVGEPAEGSLTQIQTYSTKPKCLLRRAHKTNPRSVNKPKPKQILNDGCLGSYNDEERSEVR